MDKTQKTFAIGVDLGGTNTVFGIVDAEGNIVAQDSIKTQAYHTAEAFVEAGVKCLQPLIAQVGGIEQIAGMGIGAPNANYYSGAIETAPNIAWAHERVVPLARMFSEKIRPSLSCGHLPRNGESHPDGLPPHYGGGLGRGSFPVRLTNDANAAAMGEMAYGVARGMKNFIVITLGTGVGSGIVINGQLVYGHDGFAGELGHVTMVRGKEGRLCGCGRTGCLETYCSATGVARTAREILANTDRPSLLRDKPADQIESLDVSIAAGKGDEVANEIFQFTGKMLGEACADFAAFSSPEAFIFFGGLCKAGDLIMKPIEESYNQHVMPIFKGKAKFLVSGLMNANAAVLGASALALR
ncbi:MAG: ROK family protein [Bacteroidaceae bacterium]|nr:ROK family protein [Bacteroidaceae bacterium]